MHPWNIRGHAAFTINLLILKYHFNGLLRRRDTVTEHRIKIWILSWQVLSLFTITRCLENSLVTSFNSEVEVFASDMCHTIIKKKKCYIRKRVIEKC